MSRRGDIGRLTLTKPDAIVVAGLISARAGRFDLAGTAFEGLPAFARKLDAATRRKRRAPSDEIVLWSLPRAEATSAFHYLALFSHPDASALTDARQKASVDAVALEVARALLARSGRRRLDAREVAERIAASKALDDDGSATSPLDERFVRRLEQRARAALAMQSTRLASIPPAILALLTPAENSR